ncbi:MAG: nucleoside/nucleotide kinase family protein [Eubacteriales bacterium]
MNYNITINGLSVNATYSDTTINTLFLPLLKKLISLQKASNRRIIIFISAPPAVGKSTLVSFLEYLANTELHYTNIQGIGIDGFHFYNSYLEPRDLMKEKGSIRTFDIEKLYHYVEKLTKEDTYFPRYYRNLHNPVEDDILLDKDIILLEGNYLSSPEKRWMDLRKFSDYNIFINADVSLLRNRLIERKMKSGASLQEATDFYENSDKVNALYVLNNRTPVDLTLTLVNGDFSYI